MCAQLTLLRTMLGPAAIPCPAMNIASSFATVVATSLGSAATSTFSPYTNDLDFLVGARPLSPCPYALLTPGSITRGNCQQCLKICYDTPCIAITVATSLGSAATSAFSPYTNDLDFLVGARTPGPAVFSVLLARHGHMKGISGMPNCESECNARSRQRCDGALMAAWASDSVHAPLIAVPCGCICLCDVLRARACSLQVLYPRGAARVTRHTRARACSVLHRV